MKKVIALGGSNSKNSINKKLAVYAAGKLNHVELEVVDLNDFDLPLFGIDLEIEHGIHPEAIRLNNLFGTADGFVVSLAEHNSSYSAAFKSAYDWLSRIEKSIWNEKPMLLMAASPGARGGKSVLEAAEARFSRQGADIVAIFSLPHFNENFSEEGIVDDRLKSELNEKVALFQQSL